MEKQRKLNHRNVPEDVLKTSSVRSFELTREATKRSRNLTPRMAHNDVCPMLVCFPKSSENAKYGNGVF